MGEYDFPYLKGNFAKEEIEKDIPLPLLPHHLSAIYAIVVQHTYLPIGEIGNPNDTLKQSVRREAISQATDEAAGFPNYGTDITGSKLSEIRRYYHRTLDLHQLVEYLPPEYPVFIRPKTEDSQTQDVICKNCIVGNHCALTGSMRNENKFSNLYLRILTEHPELQVGDTTSEILPIRPGQEEPEITIMTNMGTMRNVFRYYFEEVRKGDLLRRYFGDF